MRPGGQLIRAAHALYVCLRPLLCSGTETPPPSPPHPLDCTTNPQYHEVNNWGTSAEVEVCCPMQPAGCLHLALHLRA